MNYSLYNYYSISNSHFNKIVNTELPIVLNYLTLDYQPLIQVIDKSLLSGQHIIAISRANPFLIDLTVKNNIVYLKKI